MVEYGTSGGHASQNVRISYNNGRSETTFVECSGELPRCREADVEMVRSTLAKFGYLSERTCLPMQVALAKFYHVNRLGALVVYPLNCTLAQACSLMACRPEENWMPYPGNLVYVEPIGHVGAKTTALSKKAGSGRAAGLVSGGGPFMVDIAASLVHDVLQKLGYVDLSSDLADAMHVFCEVNGAIFRKHGIRVTSTSASDRQKDLYHVFINQDMPQQWKIPRSDASLRKLLRAKGLLNNEGAEHIVVKDAIRRWLEQHGQHMPASQGYLACVLQMLRELERNPNYRA